MESFPPKVGTKQECDYIPIQPVIIDRAIQPREGLIGLQNPFKMYHVYIIPCPKI